MYTALPHLELISSDRFPEVKYQTTTGLNLSFIVVLGAYQICLPGAALIANAASYISE